MTEQDYANFGYRLASLLEQKYSVRLVKCEGEYIATCDTPKVRVACNDSMAGALAKLEKFLFEYGSLKGVG